MSTPNRQITRLDIEREIEAKGIGPEDAFQIREFATYLSMAGKPGKMTRGRLARLRKRFGDEYLGISPVVARWLNHRESCPQCPHANGIMGYCGEGRVLWEVAQPTRS